MVLSRPREPELAEMGTKNNHAMTKELQNAFRPFWTGDRYQDEFEIVYITGSK